MKGKSIITSVPAEKGMLDKGKLELSVCLYVLKYDVA